MRTFFLMLLAGWLGAGGYAGDSLSRKNELVVEGSVYGASNFLERSFFVGGLSEGLWNPSLHYRPFSGAAGFFMEVRPFSVEWRRTIFPGLTGWLAVRRASRLWIRLDEDLGRFIVAGNPPGSDYHWTSGHVAGQEVAAVQVGFERGGWRVGLGVGRASAQQVLAESGDLFFPASADTIFLRGRFVQEVRAEDAPAVMFSLGWERSMGPLSLSFQLEDWGVVVNRMGKSTQWDVRLSARAADLLDTPGRDDILGLLQGGLDSADWVSVSTSEMALPPVAGTVRLDAVYSLGRRRLFLEGMVWPMGEVPYWRLVAAADALPVAGPWVLQPAVQLDAARSAGLGLRAAYRTQRWRLGLDVPFLVGVPRKTGTALAFSLRVKM